MGSWNIPQTGAMMGGVAFQLIYTGSSAGVWAGVGPIIFTPGTWTFTVTMAAVLRMKACGPGGWGGLQPNPASTICGGGGGGAYTLASDYTFSPGLTYTVEVPGAGTGNPTLLYVSGQYYVLYLGAGAAGMRWDQAPAGGAAGGIVSAGPGSPGGNGGRWNPTIPGGSTSGTGGGGWGGAGNLGGTGGFNGVAGGSGESGAGSAPAPPSGYNGGCGGYGGGVVVGGSIYGRGGGGAAEVGDGVGGGNSSVYVYSATSGVIQLTKV